MADGMGLKDKCRDGAPIERGRPSFVEIDLAAIRQNVAIYRQALAPGTRLMAVVKANAYGHGAIPVARMALEAGADALGVAIAEEGEELRRAGVDASILVLGASLPSQIPLILEYGLEAVVYDWGTAECLSQLAQEQGRAVPIHLKVDTGMGRLGMLWDGPLVDLACRVARLPGIICRGLMTHFANADDPDEAFTRQQWERFLDVVDQLRRAGLEFPIIHAANSAAAWRFPGVQCQQIRLGIGLYGLSPYVRGPRLYPALSIRSQVAMVKRVGRDFPVGYGHVFRTPGPMTLATIPIGYADGYRRGLTGKASALWHEKRVPVVGRVSMDQIVLGLPPDAAVSVGDEVVLLGSQGAETVTAEEWASWLDTITYEVVAGIGPRLPRRYRIGTQVVPAEAVDDQFLRSL